MDRDGVTKRFLEAIDAIYGQDKEFLLESGMKKSTFSQVRSGRQHASMDLILALSSVRGEVNTDYILTGRGTPLSGSGATSIITDIPTTDKDIKILDIRVCAGQGIGFDGEENKVVGYVNIPDFTGCHGITVYGDSMYDKYTSGDTIFVREIIDKRNIDNGQPYVIITNEDRLLKMVYIEENTLKLVSYNTSCNPDGRRKYPDMEIDGEQILHFYKIVGRLERTQM